MDIKTLLAKWKLIHLWEIFAGKKICKFRTYFIIYLESIRYARYFLVLL